MDRYLVNHAQEKQPSKAQRGIQSIEVGGRLLIALGQAGIPMALSRLARDAAMPAAKAHRYLVSLGKLGLVKQDLVTGQYNLGPLALQLGLISLRRLDPLKEAAPEAASLAALIGHTVFISIRGNVGPTVVRIEESGQPLHVNMRTGTVMSLVNTATGRIFAAFLSPAILGAMMKDEGVRMGGARDVGKQENKTYVKELIEIRRRSLARAVGAPIPGVNALSAPIFDSSGSLVLSLTAMGPSGTFDPSWNGDTAAAVKESASSVSKKLGYPGPLGGR